jgi:exoribonuclease R
VRPIVAAVTESSATHGHHRSDDIAHHETPEDLDSLRRRTHISSNILAGSVWLAHNIDRAVMTENGPLLRAFAAVAEAVHELGLHLNQPDDKAAPAHLATALRELDAARELVREAVDEGGTAG